MTRHFTGVHMLATMIGFFGVVIAVNAYMATSAVSTFSGTVVDNSYVASQEYNKWLAQAHAQSQAGWRASARVAQGRVEVVMTSAAGALHGLRIDGIAEHPLGLVADIRLTFVERTPGVYVAAVPIPAGRWRLKLAAVRGAARAAFLQDIAA